MTAETPTPMRRRLVLLTARGFHWEPAEPFRLSAEARRKLRDMKECQGRALVRARSCYLR